MATFIPPPILKVNLLISHYNVCVCTAANSATLCSGLVTLPCTAAVEITLIGKLISVADLSPLSAVSIEEVVGG